MSNHSKSASAVKVIREESLPEEAKGQLAEIIPWPDIRKIACREPKIKKRVRLEGKYLYHRGKKTPILQFQKSGYDRLLKLLVKEIV